MSGRSRDGSNIVKFPIGRVVREHRNALIVGATSEEEAIAQSLVSVRRAITTLRRQESSLFLRSYRAWKGNARTAPPRRRRKYAPHLCAVSRR